MGQNKFNFYQGGILDCTEFFRRKIEFFKDPCPKNFHFKIAFSPFKMEIFGTNFSRSFG